MIERQKKNPAAWAGLSDAPLQGGSHGGLPLERITMPNSISMPMAHVAVRGGVCQ